MRKDEVAGSRVDWHTSEKKRKETTCAERRGSRIERRSAHVREEKKGHDVCGRTRLPMKEGAVTCQERKKQEVLKKNRKRDEIYNTTGNYSGSMWGKQ